MFVAINCVAQDIMWSDVILINYEDELIDDYDHSFIDVRCLFNLCGGFEGENAVYGIVKATAIENFIIGMRA